MLSGVVASLSARRAWIEIADLVGVDIQIIVALRKESVDRNWQSIETPDSIAMSLSARRAWIEIAFDIETARIQSVALRKESVDRNWMYALV